jgi:tetratricopeptide (TPR) repeat protein
LLISVTISVVSLLAVGLLLIRSNPWQSTGSVVATTAVKAELATLHSKSPAVELTPEKSTRVRIAISHGDFRTARQIIATVLAASHLQNWRFYPFSGFMDGVTDLNSPGFEARLNEWIAQDPSDAIPPLIRAQYHHDMGWFIRGHGFANVTPADHMAAFATHMKKALVDVNSSIGPSNENPYAYYLRLLILRGFGGSSDLGHAFEQGVAKYPDYYPLYDTLLGVLEPRWGGNVPAMYAFVDRFVGRAADQSPLNLLYVSLYARLLSSASLTCTNDPSNAERISQCVVSIMGKIVTPELQQRLLTALNLYDHSDKHQFDLAISDLLSKMLTMRGGDDYSGALLQLAASAMHSDTQLKEDNPSSNDYAVDAAVAASWYQKGYYDNANHKVQEALVDVKSAAFPDEEERDFAIAGIYGLAARIHNKLGQYAKMIAYQKAYLSLGGRKLNGDLICYGYYRLKDLHDGLAECSENVTDGTGGAGAQYWRGMMYLDLSQPDSALHDFVAVADSNDDDYRSTAAIAVSMIYFNQNDNRGALDALNKYSWLYDPRVASKSNVAVAYNNRCYAHMQLGDLKKALEDCNASLKYGNLPDAYRKQQELIERLAAHKGAL